MSRYSCDADHFFGRGDAFGDQPLAVLAHRAQAGRLGNGEDLCLRRPAVDQGRMCSPTIIGSYTPVRPCSRSSRSGRSPPGGSDIAELAAVDAELRTRRCAARRSARGQQEGLDAHVDHRVTVLGASLVWTVASTRWPVSEAWIAICAVS
jgi:hypothetical protein